METLRIVFEICTGITVIAGIIGGLFAVFRWLANVKNKDDKAAKDIKELRDHTENEFKAIKDENTLICYGLSACLDGLINRGATILSPLPKTSWTSI